MILGLGVYESENLEGKKNLDSGFMSLTGSKSTHGWVD
jgi:hypothetical protein